MPEDNGISEFVEQRTKGRRADDQKKCAMCDFITDKNDDCFSIIKRTMREETNKTEHRFEIFESRLESYMTKWAVGVIILVCSGLLGTGGAFGLWQLESVHQGQIRTNDSILALSESIAKIGTKQERMRFEIESIKAEIKKLMPEHRELMEHIED